MYEKFKCAKVVQNCPNFSGMFYEYIYERLDQFSSSTVHFWVRRGLKGSETAIITRPNRLLLCLNFVARFLMSTIFMGVAGQGHGVNCPPWMMKKNKKKRGKEVNSA